jgi:thiamine-phosphate pyrophosphorylase
VDGLLIESPGPGSEAGDGVHLGAADPWSGGPSQLPVGRSCHSERDLSTASAEGCRWATLSPIFPSGSKPGYGPPLGLSALADVPLPTWALGGINEENAPDCLRSGAAGVAVMGAVLRAPDPAGAVAKIQERIDGVQR